jgi:hypothetical protein
MKMINSIVGLISGITIGLIVVTTLSPVMVNGPSSTKVKQMIFKGNNGNCYKLYPQIHICPIKKSMGHIYMINNIADGSTLSNYVRNIYDELVASGVKILKFKN